MELQKDLPPKPPKAKPPPVDEKPWPVSVQIAGYVGGAVLVPYLLIWTITSNPTLRDLLGPYLPMDTFRSHFGQLEWDVQSYVDEMQFPYDSDETNDPGADVVFVDRPVPNVQYYQFPGEPGFVQRQQQRRVDELDQSDVKVTIRVFENSNGVTQSSQDFVQSIPARTLANAQNLWAAVKGAVQNAKDATTTVAVDFEDDDDTSSSDSSEITMQAYGQDASAGNPAKALLKKTQIFSSWLYVSPAQQQLQQEEKTSDVDMTISRLEYTVAELQRSLKDPTCTRDMDEMADELRNAKKELSGLRWKRRLGWK
jgi:hypothetical protein